jgi:hypothetical protein
MDCSFLSDLQVAMIAKRMEQREWWVNHFGDSKYSNKLSNMGMPYATKGESKMGIQQNGS